MGSRYEVELTVISAKDLKNVNWKHGELHPYAVVWLDPAAKCSTRVAVSSDGEDTDPIWSDESLTIPVPPDTDINNAVLSIDVVHAGNAGEIGTKPLIGSTRIHLHEIADDVGIGRRVLRNLKLKRPSGRPQGRLEVEIAVLERYYDLPPPPAATTGSHGYAAPLPPVTGSYGYAAPPPTGLYGYAAAPSQATGSYGRPYTAEDSEKKSKFGMGTGLAVGAAAGVLGGITLVEGAEYLEDKIEDDVAERVEDDLGYDGDDF